MPLSSDQEILAKVYAPQLEAYRAELADAKGELGSAATSYAEAANRYTDAVERAGRASGKVAALVALMEREGVPIPDTGESS